MYRFNYVLTEKDYLEFNKIHMLRSPANKKFNTMLRFFIPAFLFLMILISWGSYENQDELIGSIIINLVFSLIWFFAFKPLNGWFLKLNIKMMKKRGKLPYSKEGSIQFDEDFIVDSTEEQETKVKYKAVERIVLGDNAVYIYISSIQAFIVPFSVFKNDEQKAEFLAFINNKMDAAKGISQ